jgi:hypothetical protein
LLHQSDDCLRVGGVNAEERVLTLLPFHPTMEDSGIFPLQSGGEDGASKGEGRE